MRSVYGRYSWRVIYEEENDDFFVRHPAGARGRCRPWRITRFAAEYDSNKPITLRGAVTKMEWQNPHARFYVDVTDEAGKVTNWELELGSPNGLMRAAGPETP